ncbi:hypothetical protein [Pseudomonas sp. AH2]|uniref:hypothetical protein n=1 Tax=Pseudomonas sp. AH2 TaxID=181555 RepID=UPI002AC9ADFF|nr:hypothetical protein [Pseudomonas sp. AH2]WPX29261.1 hypothetical protein RHM64_06320 [Pseudomonas sp. AH2]
MAKSSFGGPPPINREPYAGMIETFASSQISYLAPTPLPTDRPAKDYGGAVGAVNDSHLDFGIGLPAVFGWQVTVGFPLFWYLMCVGLLPLLVGLTVLAIGGNPEEAGEFIFSLMPAGSQFGAWGGGAVLAILLITTFNNLAKYETLVPTRFNRQRREVCFVPAGQTEPIFVPWESLCAWVIQSQSVTQYGATLHYAMGIGFYHPPDDQQYTLEFQCGGFELAVCNWEAIRAYMEYEVHTLKDIQDPLDLQGPDDPPHEGLHTFYNARERMRRRRKAGEVGWSYPFWWYLYHVMTLWTLPNHLTEWEIRRIKSIGHAAVPEAMQAWSAPLPESEWAKPSDKLQRMSKKLKELRTEEPQVSLIQHFVDVQVAEAKRG